MWANFLQVRLSVGVVGTGSADKAQVQYMVQHILSLKKKPSPDHAADALAAAICYAAFKGSIPYEEQIRKAAL